MKTLSIRLNDVEARAIDDYAVQQRRTVSDAARVIIMERLEDEYDLTSLRAAKKEFLEDPVTYSLDEVMAGYGIDD